MKFKAKNVTNYGCLGMKIVLHSDAFLLFQVAHQAKQITLIVDTSQYFVCDRGFRVCAQNELIIWLDFIDSFFRGAMLRLQVQLFDLVTQAQLFHLFPEV